MAAGGETSMIDKPQSPMSWVDALILAGALFGVLMGVSLISFEAATVFGLVCLGYVILKLLST